MAAGDALGMRTHNVSTGTCHPLQITMTRSHTLTAHQRAGAAVWEQFSPHPPMLRACMGALAMMQNLAASDGARAQMVACHVSNGNNAV